MNFACLNEVLKRRMNPVEKTKETTQNSSPSVHNDVADHQVSASSENKDPTTEKISGGQIHRLLVVMKHSWMSQILR
ncbi:hypothetical protein DCAR_0311922 [Daucus carota subsp. sativus]|uniref:Uncharacterized protein n=1 Tax=Daucus carota subsp. sativus TaxID=79200 RepID=A0A166ASE0_DAUCS|nr:hypothetical protein DCAR_0311922 [Daucus carota subsp. sativus]